LIGWTLTIVRLDGANRRDTAPEQIGVLSTPTPRQGGAVLATVDCGLDGLDWLDVPLASGDAVQFGDPYGYPNRYIVRAGACPHVHTAVEIPSEEWLYIEAWDKS
jgi:hypothetical protein